MGAYLSLPLNNTYIVQQTFPILITDFNQSGRLMITQWGNELESVNVEICYTTSGSCWSSQGTKILSPSNPMYSFNFNLSYFGYSLQVRMATSSSKQGFVAYQIL